MKHLFTPNIIRMYYPSLPNLILLIAYSSRFEEVEIKKNEIDHFLRSSILSIDNSTPLIRINVTNNYLRIDPFRRGEAVT